jgi:hypothetical protein
MIIRKETSSRAATPLACEWYEWMYEMTGKEPEWYHLIAADSKGQGKEWLALVAEHNEACGETTDTISSIIREKWDECTMWLSRRFDEIVDKNGNDLSHPYAIVAIDFTDEILAVQQCYE